MKILYLTQGSTHPSLISQQKVYNYLGEYIKTVHSTKWEKLENLHQICLDQYQVVVAFFHVKGNNEKTVEHLSTYIKEGGLLVALHGVSASFKGNEEWFEVVGGTFIGHPPVGEIQVSSKDENYMIKDELYRHRLREGVSIKMVSSNEEEEQASVWLNQYGKGTVVYNALGHDDESVASDTFKQLFKYSLELGNLTI